MAEKELVVIGKVVSSHPSKGEVRVLPLTDSKERFEKLNQIFLERRDGSVLRAVIEGLRYHKDLIILKLDSSVEWSNLKGSYISIRRQERLKLEEGRYYISDLMGMKVLSQEGECLGRIDRVLQTGSNDVYVVKGGRCEILIPAIGNVVKEVDLERKVMTVHLLEGLR